MPPSDFDSALDALILASRAVVGIAARSLPPWADVSLVQFRALVLLEQRGSLKPGTLAELLEVSPSTVTGLCDRLAARQLIVRQPGSENRREVVLELSPTGKAGRQRYRRPPAGDGPDPRTGPDEAARRHDPGPDRHRRSGRGEPAAGVVRGLEDPGPRGLNGIIGATA